MYLYLYKSKLFFYGYFNLYLRKLNFIAIQINAVNLLELKFKCYFLLFAFLYQTIKSIQKFISECDSSYITLLIIPNSKQVKIYNT